MTLLGLIFTSFGEREEWEDPLCDGEGSTLPTLPELFLEKRAVSKSSSGKHSLKIRAGVYLTPGNLF